jgi:hypothetical protein
MPVHRSDGSGDAAVEMEGNYLCANHAIDTMTLSIVIEVGADVDFTATGTPQSRRSPAAISRARHKPTSRA